MNLEKILNLIMYILGLAFNLAIVAALIFAVFWVYERSFAWGQDLAAEMAAEGPDYTIEFVIEEDTPAAEIARRLEEKGIIANRWLFQLELFLKASTRVYREGTFHLNRNMSNTDVNATLRARPMGQAEHLVITIPEGWNMRDMANYFEYREFFTPEEFFHVAEEGHFNHIFLMDVPDRTNRLEGYLFPDTYFIPLNPNPGQIITRMLDRFGAIYSEAFHYRAEELGLTQDEIVIIASIIEAETRHETERPIISQIIHSRLAAGMPLEMRSTVSYVLDIRRDRLTSAHLNVYSPHNTFQVYGLPVGPVSNPGEASLHAALYPASTDYMYMVLESFETGVHRFYRTQAETLAAD